MPRQLFQPGNKLAKGGKREGAGRPSFEKLTLLHWLEIEEEKRAERLARRYYDMAEEDPATMRHVVDGKRPKNGEQQPAAIIHQFIQFGAPNKQSIQVPAEDISTDPETNLIEVAVWAKKSD